MKNCKIYFLGALIFQSSCHLCQALCACQFLSNLVLKKSSCIGVLEDGPDYYAPSGLMSGLCLKIPGAWRQRPQKRSIRMSTKKEKPNSKFKDSRVTDQCFASVKDLWPSQQNASNWIFGCEQKIAAKTFKARWKTGIQVYIYFCRYPAKTDFGRIGWG